MLKSTILASCTLLVASIAQAAEVPAPETQLLYPAGAPGAMGQEERDIPTITIYRPENPNGSAVVCCPGGGYGHLAMGHEGLDIANWLNGHGVTVAVLKYRIAPYKHPVPMLDVQRAIRLVRSQAEKLDLDPKRIGVMGFSAGGHLASTAVTHFDAGDSTSEDPVDRVSCRPDFGILVYPVISMRDETTHGGSKRNLLGTEPSEDLVTLMSNDEQVTKDTPPVFLMHTSGDRAVKSENSIYFYLACRKNNVPAELHIYELGGHGYGLAAKDPILSSWPDRCIDWLTVHKVIPQE